MRSATILLAASVLGALTVAPHMARAAATQPAPADGEMVVRVYEVSDLLEQLAAEGKARGGRGGDKPVDAQIEGLILHSVEPNSWLGGQANIQVIGGRLVVLQTPAVLEQIEKLLQVVINARGAPSHIESVLSRQLTINLQDTPLGQAIEKLRLLAGEGRASNLVVDWNMLATYGITPDTPLTLGPLENVELRTALDLLLEQVSSMLGGIVRLGWQTREKVIYVSTRDHLAEMFSPKTDQQKVEETETQIGLVDRMKDTYFDPAAAGILAIGAIKAELQRSGQDVIQGLEGLLGRTQSQGLRNALHMTLKDLYVQAGNQQKVMEHLTQMLAENDTSYVNQVRSGVLSPGRSGGYSPYLRPGVADERGGGGSGEYPMRGGGRGEDPMRGGGRGEEPARR